MRYRQMGRHGPTVSAIGLGAGAFGRVCDRTEARAIVDAALEAGVTFFDTAEAYPGSEELLGAALDGRRHDVVVCSKFGHPADHPGGGARGTRAVIHTSIEATLHRLATEYLDVYLMHMPDPATPLEETLSALDELVQRGLVRWTGVSNFSCAAVCDAVDVTRAGGMASFLCVENRYNLLERDVERDVLPVCCEAGLALVPHTPLAVGLLTGRFKRGEPLAPGSRLAARRAAVDDHTFTRLERLEQFAHERELSMLSLAIGWLAAQPCLGPVIAGATNPAQIRANVAAADWIPTPRDLAALDEIAEV